MENIAVVDLARKKSLEPIELFYWKDYQQNEVDIVIKQGFEVKQLIQVCSDIEDYDTKEREIKALLKASQELRCKNLVVITWEYEAEEKHGNKKIKFLPLWKWLQLAQ